MTTALLPETIVLQKDFHSQSERFAVLQTSALHDVKVLRLSMADLNPEDVDRNMMPVGSVEFVRRFMAVVGIQEPANISYPETLLHWLKRKVIKTTAGRIKETVFVKPVDTKKFTGFVFHTLWDEDDYPSHVQQEYLDFMSLPADTPVFTSEVINLVAEFRCYVHHGKCIGIARYDDGELEDVDIDQDVIDRIVEESGIHHGAIDLGVRDDGEVCLVECNDAWALGLYGHSLRPYEYVAMLWSRWMEMLDSNSPS